ncbi:MAG: LacI family DNA-binding transcriptional regulator [Chloroflexi bacterium]|nr:LacI family DNA-binding transcriptional regulator [Chloroflexota bacterium]
MPPRSTRTQATMRDVARLAGVSQSTVSRVLSRSTSPIQISQDTVQKVLDAVDKLGYRPNLTARSLRGQKTNMIAIMIADISNPMYHSIVRTVQAIARERDYDVLIANTDHVYENELHFCEAIIRRPVDGVLMVPNHLSNDEIEQLIHITDIPVVVLAWPSYYPRVDAVYGDDLKATYDAVRWLVESKGHRRVGFIGVSRTLPPGERRRTGFDRAMTDAGLAVPPDYIQEGDFSIDSGQRAMRALLQLAQPPTAVFVCNDLMAIGAIDAAKDLNCRVPEDVAVIGFDNIPEATIIRPRLTTIAQYPVEMGQQMAHAVFDRIEGLSNGTRQVFEIPCRLIEREST